MLRDERWLAAMWAFVRAELPPPPAAVLEIGCGAHGGFVPALLSDGYHATGIDPEAPAAGTYRRVRFEDYERSRPVDAVVACTSLHHVADLNDVMRRVESVLVPNGVLVVVEWNWERFDEATAQWCFARLPATAPGEGPSWLHAHQEHWVASGQSWEAFRQQWAGSEHLQSGAAIVRAVNERFHQRSRIRAPYFFAELEGTTEADEQAAIDAGTIRATGIRYSGTRR